MPTLALAGGTSPSLGRAITTAVFAQTRWNVLILSRQTNVPVWLRAIDSDGRRHAIEAVDYGSTNSVAAILKAHNVHTLISVTSAVDGTQAQTQINLLRAAVQAGCSRFAPSQWGFGPKGWNDVDSLKWASQGVREECAKHRGKIEFAYFNQGSFMNYIGHGIYPTPEPSAKNGEEEELTQFRLGAGYKRGEDQACEGLLRQGPLADKSGAFLVGLENSIAELPIKDNGQWPRITFTSLRDVGLFVAASLELPKWEEEMGMAGDTVTMGELLASAEAVTGKKFDVAVLQRQDLEARLLTATDFIDRLWIEFNLACIRDREDEVVVIPTLNQLCPSVKPVTVRGYMDKNWTKA